MDALAAEDVFLFDDFRLDGRGGGLFRRDERGVYVPMALGSRALDVLRVLVERPGDLVSRDQIIAAVWPATVVEDNNLNMQIAALRRVLDDGRVEGSCIQTVPGRGYRFVLPVTRSDPTPPLQSTPPSGNGSGAPIVENEQLRDPHLLDQIDAPPPLPASRARHWFRGSIASALIVTLGLVAAVAAGANWRWPWYGQAHPAPRLSIAVLPLANLSDDPKQQYFADGITEDLTTDLSRLPDMLVISRNTSFTYRDKPINAKQIGRELGVRYVVEGSIQRSADQVRVNAQLIDTETNTHLWAERFERDTRDLFALQTEITSRIAIALNLALIDAEAVRPREHPDALDYIFRGRAAANKPQTRETRAEAIGQYERALALDPRSVEAQSVLAGALAGRAMDGMADSAAADIARAEGLADQALAASPRSPVAHYGKGQVLRAQAQVLREQGRCEEAIPEYEAAIEVNRNLVFPIAALGWCKFLTGSIEEVIPLVEKAIRLSPHDPAINNWYQWIGVVHLLQSHTDEAIVWLERARNANPVHPLIRANLASAYGLKGETERAAAELAEARRLSRDGRFSSIVRLKAAQYFGVPAVRALYEATYFVGLRKAGMPEE
jgi:TolB-like protein/DNA-binding winged helix-turn-helix (wHTH) protein/Flp pilus assembly protein TadD